MTTPPKLYKLCADVLGKHPEHITSLQNCDLAVTALLLNAVLRHGKLDVTVAQNFFSSEHPEIQEWLKKNLAWPYNEMLTKKAK